MMTRRGRIPWLCFVLWLPALALGTPPVDWPELIQKPHAKLPLKDLGLRPLLETADGQKITTSPGWATQRQRLHELWMERLGKPPQKPDKVDVRIEKTEKLDGHTRQLLSFHSADGDRIRA